MLQSPAPMSGFFIFAACQAPGTFPADADN
jgi:hypothetical protein